MDRKGINLRKQDKPCLPKSEAKGGKARVAIECACKRISVSLNDRCMQEHYLTYKLVDGVLRCWQSSYAADVECMNIQDAILEKDSNTLRFSGILGTSNILTYLSYLSMVSGFSPEVTMGGRL